MRDKILISIIFVLTVAIAYVNLSGFKINQKSKQENNISHEGQVKSAQHDNSIYSFQKNITKTPNKKNSYFEPNHIWAESYILLDADSSHVLAMKNESNVIPIASTTKIMTAVIAIENYNLDDVLTISETAAYQTPFVIGLMPGEKITVRELLHGLLIRSGNDTAYALAEHMGFDNFINKMNEKAQYLGLENTNLKDPAGLDDDGKSSARDLAFLAKYALKYDLIREIMTIPEKTIYSLDGSYAHFLENSNRLILNDELFYYAPAIGMKTGYTPDAGHCLVSAANKDGHTLVAVILNTYEDTAEASAKESKKLLEWGYENYTWND